MVRYRNFSDNGVGVEAGVACTAASGRVGVGVGVSTVSGRTGMGKIIVFTHFT